MKPFFRLPFLLMLWFPLATKSQHKPTMEFGKISAKDFSLEGIKADTSYGAIIIADIGKSSFIENRKGWFSLVYKHQRRIKIISAKGFEMATVNIPLYNSIKTDDEEKLESLKASTYNLVDGQVVETKLDKDNVFKEVQDRNHSVRKFSMPVVKEGSIIEYSYTIQSDFLFNLQPWSFQGSYPRLWSEYELNLPEFFQYVFLTKGYQTFHIKETKEKFQSYVIRQPGETSDKGVRSEDQIFSLSSTNTISRWVMKDVPAIKEESFTSSIENYMTSIEFQQSGQQFPGMPFKDILGSWESLSLELLKDKDFGADFTTVDKNWVNETTQGLQLNDKSALEKAKLVYDYVQKNFSCKGIKGIYLSQPLKETLKTKKGFVPDLNLLLTLLLKNAGLNSEPVLLSTRSHGMVTESYPIVNQYNYVVSKVVMDKKVYYLDASKKNLGFNKLPQTCYNGAGISIALYPHREPLHADSIQELKATNIVLVNDQKNKNRWEGNFNSYLGYYESLKLREEISEKGMETFTNKMKDAYTGNLSIDDIKMEYLEDNEKVIKMNYILSVNRDADNNLVYFNPMIKEGLSENYFKSTERNYPVELPFKMVEIYQFQIQVPEGYEIDELPKSTKASLYGNDGSFEYLVSKTNTDISLLSKISINKSIFNPDEYEDLKNFFDLIVKKHAEQIVFKKK
jgi:hypothetical protein